jgi:CheY-like chemotaxis protein
VLVVDDNAVNRQILEEVLASWGMRPACADGGEAALAELRRAAAAGEAYPLVLLDAQMPGLDGFAVAEQVRREPALAGATVMMLTSLGQHEDARRCRDLGLAAYLVKPVKQSDLFRAILAALGKTQCSARAEPAPPRQAPAPEAAMSQGARILLVEDNAINQLVALRLLEKAGHAVVVAANGKEALTALEREEFDLALLDVQMPELDGLELAASVRSREKDGRRLPLIALTAHAMKGDRERCLAAGMDAYLAKPIQADELLRAVGEALAGRLH